VKSLIIKGKDNYINHMYSHLRKEHPSTITRTHLLKNDMISNIKPTFKVGNTVLNDNEAIQSILKEASKYKVR